MKRDRGMLLISILGIMAVVLMLMGAFLSSSQHGMFRAAHYRDLIRAEQAAKGGPNEIIAILEADKNFDKPLQGSLDGASYSITFDTSKTNYSVNNLSGARGSSDIDGNYKDLPLSAQKHSVYPHTADLIVVAQCGTARRVFHTLVQEGVSSLSSATSVGPIKLTGNVSIDGVKSAVPHGISGQNMPAAGGLASKFQSLDPKPDSTTISWAGQPGNDAFELSPLSKLQAAAPHADGKAFSDNLTSLLSGTTKLIGAGAADSIPDIKVAAKVEEGFIDGTPLDGPLTGPSAPKYIFVQGKRSLTTTPSDNTVNSLALAGGALFVKGDLNVKGGIRGTGTVYVDGNVTIDGGNGIIETAQPVGTALIASGNVTLKGGSKLDNLIPQLDDGSKFLDPSTKQSYDDLLQELNNYKNSAGGAGQLASIAGKISTTTGIFDPAA